MEKTKTTSKESWDPAKLEENMIETPLNDPSNNAGWNGGRNNINHQWKGAPTDSTLNNAQWQRQQQLPLTNGKAASITTTHSGQGGYGNIKFDWYGGESNNKPVVVWWTST
ncbi:hypothetical protein OS493_027146 [Desmophyllum pertusum]|uniref:Uncharacterized protein n=1 Tax=Desmophyllum pertusum TaxID=174260 RepID=A0A9W9ZYB8_9CNID|nr:hypothetical protein OS493_027146 [Desmophyllum pertusum]